jgi:hypothetical protein
MSSGLILRSQKVFIINQHKNRITNAIANVKKKIRVDYLSLFYRGDSPRPLSLCL